MTTAQTKRAAMNSTMDFNGPYYVSSDESLQPKIDNLPEYAILKLLKFGNDQEALSGLQAKTRENIAKLEDNKREFETLLRQYAFQVERQGVKADAASKTRAAEWKKSIAHIDRQLAQLRPILNRSISYPPGNWQALLREARKPFVAYFPDVVVPHDSTPEAEYALSLAMIADLEAEKLVVYKRSQPPLEVALEQAKQDIYRRAEQNAPKFDALMRPKQLSSADGSDVVIYSGNGSIKWPLDYAAQAEGRRSTLDSAGMLFWLNRDAIFEKAAAEIRKLHNPDLALSEPQRRQRIAELDAAILAEDRRAVVLFDMAAANGVTLAYRVGVNPLAVLGIKEDES